MTKRNIRASVFGMTAVVAVGAFAPLAAQANDANTQNQKNLMRDLAIGGAALGGYGLLNHNSTLGLLGVAGAALAGSQYEKDRHQQSVDNSHDQYRYFHRSGYGGGSAYYGASNGSGSGYYNGYNYRHPARPPFGNAYGWQRHTDNNGDH